MSSTVTCVHEGADRTSAIWDQAGRLRELNPHPRVSREADVAVIIVNRNRPDLTDVLVGQVDAMGTGLEVDAYVIEMGSEPEKLGRHCSLRYDDPDFRGKCYGHNVGLRLARSTARYRYYWILMNDLVFEEGVDSLGELVRIADADPRMAILSPTEHEGASPVGAPVEGADFHLVPSPDYLSLLVRSEAIEQVGFLNPEFKYCWGAIVELCYKLYAKGWKAAYCDRVVMKHLGGTTYGKVKGAPSRSEYQLKAAQFAARYFLEHYGNSWDEVFVQALPAEVDGSLWPRARKSWEQILPQGTNRPRGLLGSLRAKCKRVLTRVSRGFEGSLRRAREEDIRALDPWYYPVEIHGARVVPGIGARQSEQDLIQRIEYRTKLLVDEVVKHYNFRGKRLLDLASNCAYWSARYAERGAKSLLALEGRLTYVKQGELYWSGSDFMKSGQYQFVHGNVMDGQLWQRVKAAGPFDFALCCGVLYHIPDYVELLERTADVTREAILIDTRVEGMEQLVEEPGGCCFDAIIETRVKKVPALNELLATLKRLGFEPTHLHTDGAVPQGLHGADDYSLGNRVAVLAMRKDAP
jgi:hypothetical protein